jgi:hypothetical protein
VLAARDTARHVVVTAGAAPLTANARDRPQLERLHHLDASALGTARRWLGDLGHHALDGVEDTHDVLAVPTR